MIDMESLIKKITILPPQLLQEVADYVDFIESKNNKKIALKANDITLASQYVLGKDWLKPEEDEA